MRTTIDPMSSIWTVRRSATDHKVSGLAAGLADGWNVDPMLVRVGFAVLALSGGVGLVLYAAGWLMLPIEGKQQSQLEEWIPQSRNWSRELKVGVVVVACVIGAAALSWLVPFSFAAALVVAAVWYFGYYRNRHQRHPERPGSHLRFAEFPGEPTPFTEAATAWQQRIAEYERARVQVDTPAGGRTAAEHESDPDHAAFLSHPDPVGLYSEPAPDSSAIEQVTEQRQLRRRSARRLGLVSLVVLGLTMTGLGIASAAGAPITVAAYLSAALLIFGLTLLAGARFGRPAGLAFGTVVVALAMIFSLLAQNNTAFARDIGVEQVHYASATEMPTGDHLRAGQLTVDLRDVPRPARSRTYTASVQTGRLIVDLPRGVPTELTGTVDDGMIKADGREPDFGPKLVLREPAPADTQRALLKINLHVGRGQLEVRR